MLPLKSRKWAQLHHAYGSGANIPPLLEQLIASTDGGSTEYEELWDEIWNLLCHQGTTGSASYAAVPHIIELAAKLSCSERLTYLHFIRDVEIFRVTGPEPDIPVFLQAAYFSAHRQAIQLILECLKEDWQENELQILLGALATVKGTLQLGAGISWLYKQTHCPVCYTTFPTNGYSFFMENMVPDEGIVELKSDDPGFTAWMNKNPLGFIIPLPKEIPISGVIIHRSGCSVLTTLLEADQESPSRLACIPDRNKLWNWLARYDLHVGRAAVKCEQCRVD